MGEPGGRRESRFEKVEKKRQREQYVVEEMIWLYCRKNHSGSKAQLCPVCQKLADYAKLRSQKCPFMENRRPSAQIVKYTVTSRRMREKIRQVMRFSGPRMLLYHPVLAVWHLICSKREKRRESKK